MPPLDHSEIVQPELPHLLAQPSPTRKTAQGLACFSGGATSGERLVAGHLEQR